MEMKKLKLWAFLFNPSIFQVKTRNVGASLDLSETTSLNHFDCYFDLVNHFDCYFDLVKEILNSRNSSPVLMEFVCKNNLDYFEETAVLGLEMKMLYFVYEALFEAKGFLEL